MIPILPHFASECLQMIKVSSEKINWPSYDKNLAEDDHATIIIQINGKKRGLLKLEKNIDEENLYKIIKSDEKLNKYLVDKKIQKKIFIKNKLINIII